LIFSGHGVRRRYSRAKISAFAVGSIAGQEDQKRRLLRYAVSALITQNLHSLGRASGGNCGSRFRWRRWHGIIQCLLTDAGL